MCIYVDRISGIFGKHLRGSFGFLSQRVNLVTDTVFKLFFFQKWKNKNIKTVALF